ncbi:MAG: hypothetical protein ACKN9W_10590 [Methylococcus sp.]
MPPSRPQHEMYAITVGQPFYRKVESGCQFNYAPSGDDGNPDEAPHVEFILGFDAPTAQEIEGFHHGVFEAVLVELEQTPFVCIRFCRTLTEGRKLVHREVIGWQECPVHPVAAQGYVPPEPVAPYRWLLSLILVDSETQKVVGLRAFTLGTEFCQAFARSMRRHRDDFSSVGQHLTKLHDMYARYAVGEVVKRGQVLAHSLGGD